MDNRVKGLIGFGGVLLVVILVVVLAGGGDDEDSGDGGGDVGDEVQIEVLAEGEGAEAADGDTIQVRYTGTLADGGEEFDSNEDGDAPPLPVTLGAGAVVPGFEEGLQGIKEGERRRIEIPSALGYGEAGSPPTIPPNADLIFEVEAESIGSGTPPQQ